MKTNKSEEFSLRDNRIADFAKALAHPARVAILQILLKRNSCVCGDLVEELPIALNRTKKCRNHQRRNRRNQSLLLFRSCQLERNEETFGAFY